MSCNDGYEKDKQIRFVDNAIVITKGSDILFDSRTLKMDSWFHQIGDFAFESYEISQDNWVDVGIQDDDTGFDFVAIIMKWPEGTPKVDKMTELFLPDALTNYNMTIPSIIDDETNFFKIPLKDFFVWDSIMNNSMIRIFNVSPYKVTANILMAR